MLFRCQQTAPHHPLTMFPVPAEPTTARTSARTSADASGAATAGSGNGAMFAERPEPAATPTPADGRAHLPTACEATAALDPSAAALAADSRPQ